MSLRLDCNLTSLGAFIQAQREPDSDWLRSDFLPCVSMRSGGLRAGTVRDQGFSILLQCVRFFGSASDGEQLLRTP